MKSARVNYHHGDLRRALLDAACEIIEEGGLGALSVREAAKRAGVSSGAPFRHFPTRTALLTAIAEEASNRLVAEVAKGLAREKSSDPLQRLRAMGLGYLRWVLENPVYFRIISTRSLIDWDASPTLQAENESLRAIMDRLLSEARDQGLADFADLATMQLTARALVYGTARMYADGQFAQWAPRSRSPLSTMTAVIDQFIAGLRR